MKAYHSFLTARTSEALSVKDIIIRILEAIPVFSALFGGPVTVVRTISRKLAKKHQVTVYTTSALDQRRNFKDSSFEVESDAYNVVYIPRIFRSSGLDVSLAMVRASKETLNKYDVVHLYSWRHFQDIMSHHYAKKYDVPYVLQAHGSFSKILPKQELKWVYDGLFGYRVLTNALSQVEAEQYRHIDGTAEVLSFHIPPEEYEKRTFGYLGGRVISTIEKALVLDLLNPEPGMLVLDVGTGTGRVLRETVKTGATVIGLDRDTSMVKHNKHYLRTMEERFNNVHFVVADGQLLPFRDSVFDAIISIRAIKYYRKPRQGISEMSRVLKVRGKLILELSNILSWATLLQLLSALKTKEFFPRLFNFKRIQTVINNNGLAIRNVYPLHKVPPMVWNLAQNRFSIRFLHELNSILIRVTPKELMSRGLIILAVKLPTTHL